MWVVRAQRSVKFGGRLSPSLEGAADGRRGTGGLQSVRGKRDGKQTREPGQPRTNLFQIPPTYLFIYFQGERERENNSGACFPSVGALFGQEEVFYIYIYIYILSLFSFTLADHRLVLGRLDVEFGSAVSGCEEVGH